MSTTSSVFNFTSVKGSLKYVLVLFERSLKFPSCKYASLLLAEGINVDTISRRLGHENSKITKEIYLQVTQKLKENDNSALKNIKLF